MKLFNQISTVLFGLLAGGMLLIALGLVPYWRSLNPDEFTSAFATSLPTIGGTMALLTVLATLSLVIAASLAVWKKAPSRNWILAAALAAVAMLITVPIYFAAANPLLAGGSLGGNEITAELATWQQMHWLRTVVGIIGLFCAVRAGYPQSEKNL